MTTCSSCSCRSAAPSAVARAGLSCRLRDALVRLRPPVCERCGSPGPWPVVRCASAPAAGSSSPVRSAIVYDERARKLVRAWKERGLRLAEQAAALVGEVVPKPEVDARRAFRETRSGRGSEVTSRHAASRGRSRPGGTSCADLLERTRPLPRQRGLALAERRRNVRTSVVAVRLSPAARLRRGRRLHVGRDRGRMRVGAPARRRTEGRGGHRGEGSPLDWEQVSVPDSASERSVMQLQVKARNGAINDTVRAYAEKRLAKLEAASLQRDGGRGDSVPGAQPVDSRGSLGGGGRPHEGTEHRRP